MNQNLRISIIYIMLLCIKAYAQEHNSFYYHKGKKVPINISENAFYINDKILDIDTSKFYTKHTGNGRIVKAKKIHANDCKFEIERLKRIKMC